MTVGSVANVPKVTVVQMLNSRPVRDEALSMLLSRSKNSVPDMNHYNQEASVMCHLQGHL